MYLVADLETGIKEGYGRKGNPWLNQIVAVGVKPEDHKPISFMVDGPLEETIEEILDSRALLIGHNIKFDLLYLWKYQELQNWIKNGGRIWDTQLAEYYLTNLQSKMSKLRTIAVEKYGCRAREKKMETYWDKGIDTKDIPQELVLEDVMNDVLDTEIIYLAQVKKADELKMLPLLSGHMEGLLATCEMEYNGMKVDKKTLAKNRAELQQELADALATLNEVVRPHWSTDV